jgi:site-specific DNA recombinase
MHTGGIPPLGLKVDQITRKYENEEREAVIVQKIYAMYIEGKTHPEIIRELNDCGYTNKQGKAFTKNSILSILRNSKYVGEYVWNKSVAKNSKGKRNGNKQKPESEIIRIPDAIPAIIDRDTFEKVQEIIRARAKGDEPRRRATTYV